jgi:gamma-glutamylputrescine oxidase
MQRQPRRLADVMRGDMLSVYPQLAEGGVPRMEYAWAGRMAYALHKMPVVTQLRERFWVATAFGGHGLNTTAMAGALVARAIAGVDDEVRRLERFGPRWAGGPLGRVGVQLSYWGMQARDWADERRAGR